jgi:hypothetical protein
MHDKSSAIEHAGPEYIKLPEGGQNSVSVTSLARTLIHAKLYHDVDHGLTTLPLLRFALSAL